MCTPMFFTRSAQLASIAYMSRLRALWQASFNATKRGSFLPQVRTFLLCSLSKFGSFPWWNTQCVDVLCIIFGAVEPFNDNHIRCSQGHGSLLVARALRNWLSFVGMENKEYKLSRVQNKNFPSDRLKYVEYYAWYEICKHIGLSARY